jgi:hypothetical protein
MNFIIDCERAEALAICGHILAEAHDERSHYEHPEALLHYINRLIDHVHIGYSGLTPLLKGDFAAAAKEIEQYTQPSQVAIICQSNLLVNTDKVWQEGSLRHRKCYNLGFSNE